jgi:type II secretory pathway component GspD/PulD (secretin)
METTKFLKTRTGNFRKLKALLLCLCFTTGPLLAQNITLNMERTSIKTILQEIQKQTSYRFVYNDVLVEVETVTSISVRNATLETALKSLFEGKGISYEVKDNQVILHPEKKATPTTTEQRQVTGTVVDDATREVLPFVTVRVKGTNIGTVTSIQGAFSINVPSAESVLQFSFMGYETLEMPIPVGGGL